MSEANPACEVSKVLGVLGVLEVLGVPKVTEWKLFLYPRPYQNL